MKTLIAAVAVILGLMAYNAEAQTGYYAKSFTTGTGYRVWEYPYVKNGTTEVQTFSKEAVPANLASKTADYDKVGWKIRVYSNHPLYAGRAFRKPVVISQGFDPSWGHSTEDFDGLEKMLRTLKDENTFASITSEPNLLKYFYDNGYEVILVRYESPNALIESNAWAFQGVLWHVAANVVSPRTPIRVIGPSMGGLIARYALQTMRDRFSGALPNVSHFVAFDSPNRGAEIPISIQSFLLYVGYYNRNAQVTNMKANLLSPAAKQMLLYWINPSNGYGPETDAGNQSVPNYEAPATTHGAFMADINSPSNIQKLKDYYRFSSGHFRMRTAAIVNGSGNGTSIGLPQRTLIGNLWSEKESGSMFIPNVDVADIYLYSGADNNQLATVFDGDIDGWGWQDGQDSWVFKFSEPVFVENAPGGTRGSYLQVQNTWNDVESGFNSDTFNENPVFNAGHSFIPTFSAIGLRSQNYSADVSSNWFMNVNALKSTLVPAGIFETFYAPAKNQEHVLLTKENKAWFISELSINRRPLQTTLQ